MTQNNITARVNSFLDSDFITRKCLSRDIASLRALSRHIIKKSGLKDKNLDAVISAIRRYKKSETAEGGDKLRKVLSRISVKTRSDVVDIRVHKSKKSVEGISRLNSAIDIEKGEIIKVIQAEQGITIIIDDRNLEKFHSIFSRHDIISVDKKLVEVNLQFTEEAQSIRGIISIVTSSLNTEGINIVEIMSCAPELLVIVRKEDLLKFLNVIHNLQSME